MKQPQPNREELEKEAIELGICLEGTNSISFNFGRYNGYNLDDFLKILNEIQKTTTDTKTITFEYNHRCYGECSDSNCQNIEVDFSFVILKDTDTLEYEIKRKKEALKLEAKYLKEQEKLKKQENLKKEEKERKLYEKLKKKYEPA